MLIHQARKSPCRPAPHALRGPDRYDFASCTACGKQYFRPASAVPVIVLSVLLAISLAVMIRQLVIHRDMTEAMANLETQIDEQEAIIYELDYEVWELNTIVDSFYDEISFFRSYAAIVPDDGTDLYHSYICEDLDTSSFWIYNISAAEQKGYYPCPKCFY